MGKYGAMCPVTELTVACDCTDGSPGDSYVRICCGFLSRVDLLTSE